MDTPEVKETRGNPISVRFTPTERDSVERSANAARVTPSEWVRRAAVDAATGVALPTDEAFVAALRRLLARYPMGTAETIVRTSVLAIDAMEEAGSQPFRVLRETPEPKPGPGARKGSADRG